MPLKDPCQLSPKYIFRHYCTCCQLDTIEHLTQMELPNDKVASVKPILSIKRWDNNEVESGYHFGLSVMELEINSIGEHFHLFTPMGFKWSTFDYLHCFNISYIISRCLYQTTRMELNNILHDINEDTSWIAKCFHEFMFCTQLIVVDFVKTSQWVMFCSFLIVAI